MKNKETLDKHIPISYANGHFKVVPINDKVATVRPASVGEILKWKSTVELTAAGELSEPLPMITLPHPEKIGEYPRLIFGSWAELYTYAAKQTKYALVYPDFVETIRKSLPDYAVELDRALHEKTTEEESNDKAKESSGIELSEDEIKLGVSKDIDELITRIMDIATNETINEVLSLINNTCNKENDVLSIDWEIVELETVFRLDLTIEIVKWGSKKPEVLKTMGFFPLMGYF